MKYQKITGNIDQDYQILISRESLFGKVFFGWKKTKKELSKINYIWKRLLKLYGGII